MKTTASPIGSQVHSFEMYPTNSLSRSVFDRSHSLITSMNSGYIVPIWYDMAYPGDTLKISTRALSRLATQVVPFMNNVYMDVHFWSVPIRLIWSHWVNMNGENPEKYDPADPTAGTDYLTPQINTGTGVSVNSIFDYFDIPVGIADLDFNSFNFRAYNLIYNEWYRDENLIDPVNVRTGDNGVDSLSDYTLLRRGKRKDYFTSCLPFPQKGPAVDLPLGLSAPVVGNGMTIGLTDGTNNFGMGVTTDAGLVPRDPYGGDVGDAVSFATHGHAILAGLTSDSEKSGMIVDLSEATASTINGLRQAFALQRLYEKDARGGTRYTEMILSHFGVKSPDARLQRPEFLGGGTFNLNMNIVPQTSATVAGQTPLGNLASYGVINGETKKIIHSFTEHCVVIGLASIRADLTYQQGLPRDYSKRSRVDFYLPSLANLGEQAVLNKEIYAQGDTVVDTDGNVIDDQVFGYQERWAEMRYKGNRITGQLRSQANLNLDIWHLAQDFANLPTLNQTFIEETPPIDRVVAVSGANTPEFISNFYFDEQWIRPMPVYSIPSMSSHF